MSETIANLISLKDRVILVTGGLGGIGQAVVQLAAEAGATVVATYRRPRAEAPGGDSPAGSAPAHPAGEKETEGCEAPGRVITLQCDLSQPQQVEALPQRVYELTGRLDGLVNNAGMIIRKDAVDTSAQEWEANFWLHATVPARLVAQAAPYLAEHGGSVVNISSIHGLMGVTGRAAYAVSKAALIHLTRVLSTELAGQGIRVNAIAPGVVETPMAQGILSDPASRAKLESAVPLGRLATPLDVAWATLFLLSPGAGHITGQVLAVDGGRSIAAG